MMSSRRMVQAKTILICLAFGLLLDSLNAPLPFLFGSLFGCLAASLMGIKLAGMPMVSSISRTVLGVAIGTTLTMEVITSIPDYFLTLLMVPLYVLLISSVGYPFFRKVLGYDRPTAYYSSMPGGLQDMVVFGIEAGGNPRTLSLVHATRSLILITIAPIVLTQFFGLALDNPLGAPITELPMIENIGLFMTGIVGMLLFRRLRLFGADILGPLLLSAPLAMLGILTHRPSEEMIILSQFFIGLGVGIHYQGITVRELRRDIVAGISFVAIIVLIALLTLLGASQVSDIPLFELFLCFWPGGQAEIAVMTLAAGGSVSIVVLHHIVRIFLVITGAPVLHQLRRKRERSDPSI